jgi:uncharacterized protein (DUF1330 family)
MAAYLIVDVGPVHDPARYADDRDKVPAEIRRAGGVDLVWGEGVTEVMP